MDKSRALLSLLAKAGEGSYVVYASTRKLVESARSCCADGWDFQCWIVGTDDQLHCKQQVDYELP